ncbi:hypothetical protein COM13_16155 [Bacillus pseudomycoides]|uniref:hypothetical protein n=1 Tax=Bacillus pseudomycoides TaxID=64104 RepID=UPI000BEB983E|nr:hypothetical protein [Bacillus pseudomycoides]PDX99843.1 hypothetical protein COO07_14345 [Bacillus pseudomycoides]PEK82198.1 hypothetical protein CN597_03755 [Bacillus pseudomycoides]PEN09873.1 hypothetical protein CN640_10505 [Bacillus pseudomycoides]PGB88176.1 hypothetical protein COM13_16155 [Bacillus pseudomycoides]PHG29273.1 hypothetical protein COI43_19095 [Bacillus pseudomycoides]
MELERYSYNPYKKKYKGHWHYRCRHCDTVIYVPKEPTGGYYTWDYCDEYSTEIACLMFCSKECIEEVDQEYKKRRGWA